MKNLEWEIDCLQEWLEKYKKENSGDLLAIATTICEVELATRLNAEKDYGFIMPIEMFLDWCIAGYLTSYDGVGYWTDIEGNRIEIFNFNGEELPEQAVFVDWYNR
jgi:hypothetical protein